MSQSVLFEEENTACDRRIGRARLNRESSLNALGLDMVKSLKDQLERWKTNADIPCVFLEGAGSKAFCAGGDVQALYQSAIANPGGPCVRAEEFFNGEYRLDYLLHTYPKPVICWGQGIVMGGGLGLMAACSHAIVTEKTRVAMPEITIGLYPDVGGSRFLNRMPGKTGLFLALTGASINAGDCLFTGLSRHAILSGEKEALFAALSELSWTDNNRENGALINDLFDGLARQSKPGIPAGNLESRRQQIDDLCTGDDACKVIEAILSLDTDDPWLARARDNLMAGSPLSALIIHRQLQQSRGLSLAEVFQSEYLLSTSLVRYPEFAEGVRALLIDKDRHPQWQFRRIEDVPDKLMNQLFLPPQSGSTWPVNPLSGLGA